MALYTHDNWEPISYTGSRPNVWTPIGALNTIPDASL